MLGARDSSFLIRWDRAPGGHCQHQKSWLIDAGQTSEAAFVGGINLTFNAGASLPGHRGDGQRHDIYVEIAGPSASDVHHNFVQRWNEASERGADEGRWAHGAGEASLGFPTQVSAPRGSSRVQIQRTIHAGCYTDGHPAPGVGRYDIAAGERSCLEQYLLASMPPGARSTSRTRRCRRWRGRKDSRKR